MVSQMNFNERLTYRRHELGLTQARLAQLAGVHQSQIKRWEGKQIPRADNLHKLAEVLQVKMDWFFV